MREGWIIKLNWKFCGIEPHTTSQRCRGKPANLLAYLIEISISPKCPHRQNNCYFGLITTYEIFPLLVCKSEVAPYSTAPHTICVRTQAAIPCYGFTTLHVSLQARHVSFVHFGFYTTFAGILHPKKANAYLQQK